MLTFKPQNENGSLIQCKLELRKLYKSEKEIRTFNERWVEFFGSDSSHPFILKRSGDTIEYPHKTWIPKKRNGRISVLLIGGNPAPHSVKMNAYFAYEGKGTEHRLWKVFRELGICDLYGKDPDIKHKFLNLEYNSPFILGWDAIFTFPSPASAPKWSGVAGLERLFGKKALNLLFEIEKQRARERADAFLHSGGAIIAMQKHAYSAFANNKYDIKLAVEGNLRDMYKSNTVYGTPPTRWLHTRKMKYMLIKVKDEIISAMS